jgi:hypothetical protein
MVARTMRLLGSGLVFVLAAVTLDAGGWVVITVKDVPDYVVTGRPVVLTYAVRQHGMHLLDGLAGRIEARAGEHVVRAAAIRLPEAGHYAATFSLPEAGDWTVELLSGFGGAINSSRITLHAIDTGQRPRAASEKERGRRLFVAKGCNTCHVHAAVEGRSTSAGIALTSKRYDAEYLGRFLASPPRSEPFEPGRWQMPDLSLTNGEIASLVAFINAAGGVSQRSAARLPPEP